MEIIFFEWRYILERKLLHGRARFGTVMDAFRIHSLTNFYNDTYLSSMWLCRVLESFLSKTELFWLQTSKTIELRDRTCLLNASINSNYTFPWWNDSMPIKAITIREILNCKSGTRTWCDGSIFESNFLSQYTNIFVYDTAIITNRVQLLWMEPYTIVCCSAL